MIDIDDYSFKGEQFGKGTEQPNIIITIEDKDLASIVVFKDEKCYYSLAGEDEVTEEESSSRGECLSHVSDILPPEIVSVTPNTTEWVLAGIYLTVEAVIMLKLKTTVLMVVLHGKQATFQMFIIMQLQLKYKLEI